MKLKLLLGLSIALIAMSCSNDDSDIPESEKIRKIMIGSGTENKAGIKTTTDPDTYRVSWAAGDEIAVWQVGKPIKEAKRFVLCEGEEGKCSAYFEGVTEDDFIRRGSNYKVAYPYQSVIQYDGVNDYLKMFSVMSESNSTDHLANYNWLVSENKLVTEDDCSFNLKQTTALAKITVSISDFVEVGLSGRRYLSNVDFTASNQTKSFSSYIYWDRSLNVANAEMSEMTSAAFFPYQRIENKDYVFWIPIIQVPTNGGKELIIIIHWSTDTMGGQLRSASFTYTPKDIFKPGYIYDIHLGLKFTSDTGDFGSLTKL